jgi:hypothetical protein
MKANIGSVDRLVRLVVAVVLAVLVFAGVANGAWGWILAILTAIFVLTSLVGFSPLYVLFRISTRRAPKKE